LVGSTTASARCTPSCGTASGAGWRSCDDPRSLERYFTVIADSQALADIVAVAPGGSTSLKRFFGIWFSEPPGLATEGPGHAGTEPQSGPRIGNVIDAGRLGWDN
jgi:hypothetical protein